MHLFHHIKWFVHQYRWFKITVSEFTRHTSFFYTCQLKCNMDEDSNDILRPLFFVLLANHSLFSNEELEINPSNYRNRNAFLAWDLSQMPPGQSFEMTQEKPLSLILKLRRANNFVINVIVYCEYNLDNRKVICHEYAFKKHAKTNRNLPTPSSTCVILK